MKIKTTLNEKTSAFDFSTDLLKNELLYRLCVECGLSDIFIEIYSVDSRKGELFQELFNQKFDTVFIPYKNGCQDVAIKTNLVNLSILVETFSKYDFDEITVWDGNERWEQHLFSKSARGKVIVEDVHKFYLCYNSAEKKIELFCSPDCKYENISNIIKTYIT